VEIAAQMADVLGKSEEAKQYRELTEVIRKKVNGAWYDPEKASYDTGSQTANLLPLALGVLPKREKTACNPRGGRYIQISFARFSRINAGGFS
jgi:hypothetical protein